MYQSTAVTPQVGIWLQSSHQEIDTELRRTGVLPYPHDYVKDREFEQHVLPLGLKTMEDVHQFLECLDADNQKTRNPAGCTKAFVARYWMGSQSGRCFPEFRWAMIGLARARRASCSCHEVGSFHLYK